MGNGCCCRLSRLPHKQQQEQKGAGLVTHEQPTTHCCTTLRVSGCGHLIGCRFYANHPSLAYLLQHPQHRPPGKGCRCKE